MLALSAKGLVGTKREFQRINSFGEILGQQQSKQGNDAEAKYGMKS